MKTANLTPWCNLFSSESKYNICVKKSRYKVLLYTGSVIAFILLLLLFFTYSYHLALVVAVLTFLVLGFLLAKQRVEHVVVSKFEINRQGLCSFNSSSFDDFSFYGNKYYQLQASSRFSFLGCWLALQPLAAQPISAVNTMCNTKNNNKKRMLFIYRDSLSNQDFSRLSNVISQLNSQLNP